MTNVKITSRMLYYDIPATGSGSSLRYTHKENGRPTLVSDLPNPIAKAEKFLLSNPRERIWLDNTPQKGFKILGYDYSRTTTKAVIWDPRGFEQLISLDNLLDLMRDSSIRVGYVEDECLWGWCRGVSYLVKVGGQTHFESLGKSLEKKTKVSLRSVKRGSKVKLSNGFVGIYLGRFYGFEDAHKHVNPFYMFLRDDLNLIKYSSLSVTQIIDSTQEIPLEDIMEWIYTHSAQGHIDYDIKRLRYFAPVKFEVDDVEMHFEKEPANDLNLWHHTIRFFTDQPTPNGGILAGYPYPTGLYRTRQTLSSVQQNCNIFSIGQAPTFSNIKAPARHHAYLKTAPYEDLPYVLKLYIRNKKGELVFPKRA
jgi:hypothetical protein